MQIKINYINKKKLIILIIPLLSNCSMFLKGDDAPVSPIESYAYPYNKQINNTDYSQNNNQNHINHSDPKVYFHNTQKRKINRNNKIHNLNKTHIQQKHSKKNINYKKLILKSKKPGWKNPAIGNPEIINNLMYFNGKHKQQVYAATNGKVLFLGVGVKPFGKMAIIAKNNTINTVYGNLINIKIKEGQVVKKGMKIAQMGLTQNNSHAIKHAGTLIFQVRKNGVSVNPENYFYISK